MDFTKLIERLLLIIIVILTLFSLLAIVLIHLIFIDRTKYYFSFSPIGINNYLKAYGDYSALFAGTITMAATYFGFQRLKVAIDANKDKLKNDRFQEWKSALEARFSEIANRDPVMGREFIKIRYNLFKQIYDNDFSIFNKIQLNKIIQENFEGFPNFFEQQNNRYIGMGGIYNNNEMAYSFDSFRYLFLGCIYYSYPDIVEDLKTLYLEALPENRIINPELFIVATQNFRPPR